jgi:hypothetical protein
MRRRALLRQLRARSGGSRRAAVDEVTSRRYKTLVLEALSVANGVVGAQAKTRGAAAMGKA